MPNSPIFRSSRCRTHVAAARSFPKLLALLAAFLLPVAVGHSQRTDEGEHLSVAEAGAKEVVCMAMNIYHEGRGESAKGQAAIAAVTMNRVHSARYPNTVCEVVWQRKQFSWTRLAAHHHAIRDRRAWKEALVIAELFLNGAKMPQVGEEITHYHSVDVQPYWSDNSRLVVQIGDHLFYTL